MSKYLLKDLPIPDGNSFTSDKPPYTIPNVDLPDISVLDDLIDPKQQIKIYEYLLDQPWYVAWTMARPELMIYKPSNWDDSWTQGILNNRAAQMSRCMLASDDHSLEQDHPIIWQLWQQINHALGDKYHIAGRPEGMYWKDKKPPEPQDQTLATGWRVYANASISSLINHGGGLIHRDNADLADETSVTIIYMANPEWYPSWGGEILFYPEDHQGLTGDHQQFNGYNGQKRNFRIGWPDQGKVVSLKPNRVLVYDSRALHSTLPTQNHNHNQLQRRVVFRARLKS